MYVGNPSPHYAFLARLSPVPDRFCSLNDIVLRHNPSLLQQLLSNQPRRRAFNSQALHH